MKIREQEINGNDESRSIYHFGTGGILATAKSAPAPEPRFALLIYGLSAKSLSKLLKAAVCIYVNYASIMRREITIVFPIHAAMQI